MSERPTIPQALLDYIRAEADRIHHGRIIIEINADKQNRIDVITETRERFSQAQRGPG